MLARKIRREANLKFQNHLEREQLGATPDDGAFEPDSNPESFIDPRSSFMGESESSSSIGTSNIGNNAQRNNILNKKKESEKAILLKIKKLSKRITYLDFSNLTIAIFGVLFAQADADVFAYEYKLKPAEIALRTIVSVLTLLLISCLIMRYILICKKLKIIEPTKRWLDLKELRKLVLEILICGIHSPPYFGTEKVFFEYRQIGGRIRYPLDTFIFLCMMARAYLVLRVLREFSLFNYEYTDKFIYSTELESNLSYNIIIKSLFKRRPYLMLTTYFILSSCCLAFAVRMFERPFYDDPKVSNIESDDPSYQDYSLFNNAWWLIVVTMTTVGYGDYYPRTHLGRFVVILSCFCGVFMVSMSVVTLTSASEFTRGEKSTYEILHRLKQRKAIENAARKVIFYNLAYFYLKKRLRLKEQKRKEERKEFNLRTSSGMQEVHTDDKNKLIVNKEDVPYYTKLRQLTENKKRYESIFNARRKGLIPIDTEEHVKYDYSKIQKRMAMAYTIEKGLLDTLHIQEKQEKYLKMTLNNFRKVQLETNRLSMLQRSFAMRPRSDNNSTDDADKKSYYHQTSSSVVAPSGTSNFKGQKRTAPNGSGDSSIDPYSTKEKIENKIAKLQNELLKLKQEENSDHLKRTNTSKFGKSLKRGHMLNSESRFSTASRKSSLMKSPVSVSQKGFNQKKESDTRILAFERCEFSPRSRKQKSVSSPSSSKESISSGYKDDESEINRLDNLLKPNAIVSKIPQRRSPLVVSPPIGSPPRSTSPRRRSSVRIQEPESKYFTEKDITENLKIGGKSSGKLPLRRQATNINLKEIHNLYPTIDEQEGKEESVDDSSQDPTSKQGQLKEMKEMFYTKNSKPPKNANPPKTIINRRFKSKMLSLFD
ncbi:unnamed protein product [Moneuplotes crassus]|uniref:Potassium channel domain-containing protein n=1 Tax=Euplotes crassus TaxID=5936 RepID=A0AAD2D4V8_EUPCR|nr:unnamed protein product [Moneuplotes crassus]